MLKICHRINTINELLKIPKDYGVEIDIHAYEDKLTLNHDPFIKGTYFNEWIKFYDHKFLILNIKEEGIENKVLDIVAKNKIKDFFFLDLSFPSIVKLIKNHERRIATRVSDYESVQNAMLLKGLVEWVWIDVFENKLPISKQDCLLLRREFKLCIVSPELHSHNNIQLTHNLKKFIDDNEILIDAVCSKNIEIWK